jgi:peptidoglycan/LPS O-acetylase OafA/YrhL
VLFVPLVVTLAIGVGSLPRLLSTRIMVYGGYISFSLYMVHELVHTAWNWATAQFEIVLTPSWSAKLTVVGVLAVAVAGAALLYHFVEEPARIWMRRMVKVREIPVESQDAPAEAADPAHGKLQPIHGPRQMPANAVAARAG